MQYQTRMQRKIGSVVLLPSASGKECLKPAAYGSISKLIQYYDAETCEDMGDFDFAGTGMWIYELVPATPEQAEPLIERYKQKRATQAKHLLEKRKEKHLAKIEGAQLKDFYEALEAKGLVSTYLGDIEYRLETGAAKEPCLKCGLPEYITQWSGTEYVFPNGPWRGADTKGYTNGRSVDHCQCDETPLVLFRTTRAGWYTTGQTFIQLKGKIAEYYGNAVRYWVTPEQRKAWAESRIKARGITKEYAITRKEYWDCIGEEIYRYVATGSFDK